MYFCFNEYHGDNKYYAPNVFLGYYDNPKDPKNVISQIFFNDFFENLQYDLLKNILKELDKILEYSQNECISQETWFKYKVANSLALPKIGESYIKSFSKVKNDNSNGIELTYYRNRRAHKITFENNEDFFKSKPKNIFDNLTNNKSAEYNLIIKKEAVCKNEIELLYAFLQCLFNIPQTPYYIRKCKYCKKYFVATYYRTFYCSRTNVIKNHNVPCGLVRNFIKKQNEYKKFLTASKSLENKIIDKCNDEYLTYQNERDEAIEKCITSKDFDVLTKFIENSKIKYL